MQIHRNSCVCSLQKRLTLRAGCRLLLGRRSEGPQVPPRLLSPWGSSTPPGRSRPNKRVTWGKPGTGLDIPPPVLKSNPSPEQMEESLRLLSTTRDNPACRAEGKLPASRKKLPANSYQTTCTNHAGCLPPNPWSKVERLPPLHFLPWDQGHSSLSQQLPSEIWEQPILCQQLWPHCLPGSVQCQFFPGHLISRDLPLQKRLEFE